MMTRCERCGGPRLKKEPEHTAQDCIDSLIARCELLEEINAAWNAKQMPNCEACMASKD